MQARIIDLREDELYLEVDEQLRFHTKYVATAEVEKLQVLDHVSFNFVPGHKSLCIEIQSIVHPGDMATA